MLVAVEVGTVFEALAALRTLIRSLSCVAALMILQITIAFVAFPTLSTLVGSLSCVDALVDNEVRTAFEAFPTLRALVGSLSRVDTLVADEVGTYFEALLTLSTIIGSLFCMHSLVAKEVGTALEALSTLRAIKGSLFCVDALVVLQSSSAHEAFLTLRTLIGSLSCVDALVLDEFRFPFVALSTIRALQPALPRVYALVINKVGIPFKAFPTLSAWILLFLLARILAPVVFRLLLTHAEVHRVPCSLSHMPSQWLLEALCLLKAHMDISSNFFHTGATPLLFSHTTFLQILLYICDPITSWVQVSWHGLRATHTWDPGVFPSFQQGDQRGFGDWKWSQPGHALVRLQHHIPVERSLRRVQQRPLLPAEIHGHLRKAHGLLTPMCCGHLLLSCSLG